MLTIFVAATLAKTLEPHARLNGADKSTEIGIVQLKAYIIAAAEPSQLARSVLNVTPSLCLILMVYDDIGDTPLYGAAQVTTSA